MASSDYQIALLLQKQCEEEEEERPHNGLDRDHHLAQILQEQLNQQPIGNNPGKSMQLDSSRSLVDPSWELVDPTPDIFTLFITYNRHFFWNKLLAVTVAWSKRMTSCAGVCSYQGRGGLCSITLSQPLLTLRPRKDLVQTMLHEMIHAYLFVTDNNRDRDGHGPEFHKHMHRINNEAGTKITVYHDFHDEVRLYQKHWWRCEGPCQKRKPFFGMVRRAVNRAPGPNDRWWAEHSRNCGGNFIKVKEPEKVAKPTKTGKENKTKATSDIRAYLPTKFDPKKQENPSASDTKTDYTKVRNHWLNKFDDTKKTCDEPKAKKIKLNDITCPVCEEKMAEIHLNEHLEQCLNKIDLTNEMDASTKINQSGPSKAAVDKVANDKRISDFMKVCDKFDSIANTSTKASDNAHLGSFNINGISDVGDKYIYGNNNFGKSNTSVIANSKIKSNSIPHSGNASVSSIIVGDDAAIASPKKAKEIIVRCPSCDKSFNENVFYGHLDDCLNESVVMNIDYDSCIVCDRDVQRHEMETHLTTCIDLAITTECVICNEQVAESNMSMHVKACFIQNIAE